MKRLSLKSLVPRSLAGQMAILIGVALLVAQLANMTFLLNERERASLAQAEGPAITRYVAILSGFAASPPELRPEILDNITRRGGRFVVRPQSTVAEDRRRGGLEARLREALQEAGVTVRDVRATRLDAPPPLARRPWEGAGRGGRRGGEWQGGEGPRPDRPDFAEPFPRDGGPPPLLRKVRQVHLSVQLPDGQWVEGRLVTPRRDPLLTARLISATLLLYLIVLGVTVGIAAWLARPLRDITASAEGFGGRGVPAEVQVRGPGDIRRLIVAYNAMNKRVLALMDEKDRMLGAIGHDLRTPLASLRIRAENMEPAEERERLIATIEDAAAMLEDILVLARTGREREDARDVDLASLLDAVVEEYSELGRPVTLLESERTVARVQTSLLRRAIRNLVDNAISYGGSAALKVERDRGEIRISVSDQGPGIPEADLSGVLEPFVRGEASRNRATGGAGLGLAIANAVAQGHGGRLTLANRPDGGLIATLHLPA